MGCGGAGAVGCGFAGPLLGLWLDLWRCTTLAVAVEEPLAQLCGLWRYRTSAGAVAMARVVRVQESKCELIGIVYRCKSTTK